MRWNTVIWYTVIDIRYSIYIYTCVRADGVLTDDLAVFIQNSASYENFRYGLVTEDSQGFPGIVFLVFLVFLVFFVFLATLSLIFYCNYKGKLKKRY